MRQGPPNRWARAGVGRRYGHAASNLEHPLPEPLLLVGEADPELDARLSAELTRYNYAASGPADQREFTFKVEDEEGELLAGLSGWTWGNVAGVYLVTSLE